MSSKSIESQVISGLRLAVAVLLFIGIAFVLFGGMAYTFFPREHSASRITGCVLLLISVPVVIATVQRWVKALPGIFIYAVLRSLGMIAGSDSTNARLEALIVMLYCTASTALSLTFRGRKLNLVDRIALLAFVFSFAWMATRDSARSMATGGGMVSADLTEYAAMGIGLCCLLIAWAYGRIHRRRGPNHRAESTPRAIGLGSD